MLSETIVRNYLKKVVLFFVNWTIGLMCRVFANGLEDRYSIPSRHTKDSKDSTECRLA